MKKVFLLAVIFAGMTMIFVAADFRQIPGFIKSSSQKKTCVGYTIIEYNKGINCKGDTVTLVRKHGYAEIGVQ